MAVRHRARRALGFVLALLTLVIAAFAIALSHNSPCAEPAAAPDGAERTKAIVHRCYGSSDVLRLEQIPKPIPADDQVLVKVHAAALNPLDWHYMTGAPYIMRLSSGLGSPKEMRLGVDFAGTVEAVGADVTRFKPGDEVFGGRTGALAEYVAVRESGALQHKPANVTFEQAAAVPVAAITALQGLRDKGRIQSGDKVLINGASGGVGTFAVQLARFFGAEVTGVCSTKNVELVRSLGADYVIDYTQEDFTRGDQRYDIVLDNVGNHALTAYRRVLEPDGVLVMVGGPKTDPWIGPLINPVKSVFVSPFMSQQLATFLAEFNQSDLELLSRLMQDGKLTSVIDRRYTLSEVPAAIDYLGTGRARGKVIVTVSQTPQSPLQPALAAPSIGSG